MKDFELAGIRVAPGNVAKGTLCEVSLAAGTKVGVPVIVVHGREAGPTLMLTGSTHGDEIVGTGAVIAAARSVDPQQLRGTLVAVTVANPLGFENNSYITPYDRFNLASPLYWPSVPDGTITQRMAAKIGDALKGATHYLDVHGNPYPSAPMIMKFPDQCHDEKTRAAIDRMADAFGATPVSMLEREDPSSRMFGAIGGQPAAAATEHGIPGLMPELVGRNWLDGASAGRIGIVNVMKAIGMLDGELERQPQPRLDGEFVYHGALVNKKAGLLWVRRDPGVLINAGEVVGEITNQWGDVVEEVEMPVQGFIWCFFGSFHGNTGHALPEGCIVGFVAAKVSS